MVLRERVAPQSSPQVASGGAILPETTTPSRPSRNRLFQANKNPHQIFKLFLTAIIILLALSGAFSLLFEDDKCSTAQDASSSPTTKPILFVNFYRSGGNTVCRATENSTLVVTDAEGYPHDPAQNCTTPFTHPHASPQAFYRIQTCAHLLPYTMDQRGMAFHRNNLLVVSVPFFESMPCPGGYRSFAIMRDPIDRLASHVYAQGIQEFELQMWATQKVRTPSDTWMKGYPILNSMVIRQLLGQDRFVDPTPITEQDLERAKQAVDRFDVFVPLEYLHHDNVVNLIQENFAEISKNLLVESPTKRRHKPSWPRPSGQVLALMEQENKYDVMLYQYVLEKLKINN